MARIAIRSPAPAFALAALAAFAAFAACASNEEWGHRFRTERLPWLRAGMTIPAVQRELDAEPSGREALPSGELFLVWSYGAEHSDHAIEPVFTTVLFFRKGLLQGVAYSDPWADGLPWSQEGKALWASLAKQPVPPAPHD